MQSRGTKSNRNSTSITGSIMMVDVLHQSRHIDKLITAFRTAVGNYGTLDKEATSHNGVFVVFRLA
jgi:hypothetical protein